MIRAFIAITLPVSLHRSLEEVRAACQELTASLRWVQPERVHLTLKFLGNVLPESIPHVARAMEHAVAGQGTFTLPIRSLGCFPSPAHPRILWVGVDDSEHALAHLHQRLQTELIPLGFSPEDRPFRPHLTLARVQQGVRRDRLLSFLHTYHDYQFGEITVAQLCLFQSQLRRTGAVYILLHSATMCP